MIPIIIRRPLTGANGRNWPGVVILNPDAQLPAAVLAQEWWEAVWKLNPLNLILRFLPRYRRRMEVMGHEVEVQAAALIYGLDATAYRQAEAARMQRGYAGLFDGWPTMRIEAEMRRNSHRATRWVAKRRRKLEAHK